MMDERLAGAKWIKSSRSNGQAECVEVAFVEGGIAVRDSKHAEAEGLTLPTNGWRTFVRSVTR